MTDKILEVRGLTKTYGGEKRKGAKQPTPTLDVLKGIDIDIYRGDVVCLIGPSGCGKSTFLRCLNRLEIPTGGSIKFEGVEVDDDHIDAVRQKMGMVFQHFNLFPHLTVKKNLELAPSLLKLKDKEAISARADELLARVGLADKANVYPKSLSGGQQQRIAIARALAMDPDVILFDEPTSALDVSVQAQTLNELLRLQKELKIPVEISDLEYEDLPDSDAKLLRLAKELGAKVITNDFNLNKVAKVQDIAVLNVNELANAVKPVLLPGEELSIRVVKQGKDTCQGVGYLEDGTMIVVENGGGHIGEELNVFVTSALQTAAGRMVFARIKEEEES